VVEQISFSIRLKMGSLSRWSISFIQKRRDCDVEHVLLSHEMKEALQQPELRAIHASIMPGGVTSICEDRFLRALCEVYSGKSWWEAQRVLRKRMKNKGVDSDTGFRKLPVWTGLVIHIASDHFDRHGAIEFWAAYSILYLVCIAIGTIVWEIKLN
jgi:hypothetical protein